MLRERYGNYSLESYDRVTVVLPDFTASEGEVATEMERIASRHAAVITVDPHPICADDLIFVNIATFEETKPFLGLTRDNVDIQLGIGSLPEGLESALLGRSVGDTVEAEYSYLDYSHVLSDHEVINSDNPVAKNEPEEIRLKSHVEILAIRQYVIPEISDEWVKKNIALSNTVEEFYQKTAAKISNDRRKKHILNIEYDVIREVGKRLVDEPPVEVVESVTKQMNQEFDKFLESYEMDREVYLRTNGVDSIDLLKRIEKDAHDRVVQDIALVSWALHYDIGVSETDVNFMFGEATPEKTYEARIEAEATGQIETFKDLALRAKVAQQITSNAIFLTHEGAVDKLFKEEVDDKYLKQQRVREHATAEPMLNLQAQKFQV